MTIPLSPQLEIALANEASRLGVTPEQLAIHCIEAQLPPGTSTAPAKAETLYDFLKDHLASLPPASDEPRPAWLRSDNVSDAFGRILEERRRQGRL